MQELSPAHSMHAKREGSISLASGSCVAGELAYKESGGGVLLQVNRPFRTLPPSLALERSARDGNNGRSGAVVAFNVTALPPSPLVMLP